ncbi:MAG TPA: DUF2255 family protein [Myxococcota bacterium]|jgi:hypothetical protein|nr:DUF2255 family protein [Myxococcota bacterium]
MRGVRRRRRVGLAAVLSLVLAAPALRAASAVDWAPFARESVVEIRTRDEDGAPRDTNVWIVVLDERGYVRTNDSRWLANIRRGSAVALRAGSVEAPVAAREVADAETKARVEDAFKQKYGVLQRIMSALRWREPTVLELVAASP